MSDRDELTVPFAYISDGEHLYEVMPPRMAGVTLRNCANDNEVTLIPSAVTGGPYRLVKPAPPIPSDPGALTGGSSGP